MAKVASFINFAFFFSSFFSNLLIKEKEQKKAAKLIKEALHDMQPARPFDGGPPKFLCDEMFCGLGKALQMYGFDVIILGAVRRDQY